MYYIIVLRVGRYKSSQSRLIFLIPSFHMCVYKGGGDSSFLPLLNEYIGANIHQDQ